MKGITLVLVLSALSAQLQCGLSLDTAAAQTAATCSLKDNCNIEENILSVTSDAGDQSTNTKLENKIASIFEDKVNYSLKLFADETIIEYAALDRNLSNLAVNFTYNQMELENNNETDDIEESERGKLYKSIKIPLHNCYFFFCK